MEIYKKKNTKKNDFANLLNIFLKSEKKKRKIENRIFVTNVNELPNSFILFFKKLSKNCSIIMLNITPLSVLMKKNNNFKKIKDFNFLKKIIINPLLIYLGKYYFNSIINLKNIHNKYIFEKKNKTKTLLKNIQRNILNNKLNSQKIYKGDKSVNINSCCSKYKEIEVLYNNILKILIKNKNIFPDDILVVSNSIKKYFPYIKSIFKEKKNNIPYILLKNVNEKQNNILKTIYKILKINKNKITKTEVLDLLNNKYIKKKFKINSEEINILKIWIQELCIKYGIKKNNSKYVNEKNTWFYGFKKIILGYITYKKKLIYKNDAPYIKINYINTDLINKLINFINCIYKFTQKFSYKKNILKWNYILNDIIKRFFIYKNSKIKNEIKLIKKSFNKLLINKKKIKYKNKISIKSLITIIKNLIKPRKINNQIFIGATIFCNIKDLEKINFKIIYILGANFFNKLKFKRQEKFNLIYNRKEEIYYKKKYNDIKTMLDLINSTEKCLYISYIKNFNDKNYEIKILNIILKYISENYYFKKKIKKKNIFNKKNIINNISKKYKEDLCFNKNYKKKKNIFFKKKINKNSLENFSRMFDEKIKIKNYIKKNIKLIEIIKFWQFPIKYFLNNRIKLNLYKNNEENSDTEPFNISKIVEYRINKKVLKYILKKKKISYIFKYYTSIGLLPENNFGKIIFKNIVKKSYILKNKIKKIYKKKIYIKNKIKIRNCYIKFKIYSTESNQLINWKPKKLNTYDKIKFWFNHLLFCILNKCKKESKLLGYENSEIIFKKLNTEKAYYYVSKYIQGYFEGMNKPIYLTYSGMIWIENIIKKNNFKNSKKKFILYWNGNDFFKGEKKNFYIKKIIKNIKEKNIKKIYNSSLKWHLPILKNLFKKKIKK
ncbi:hypothetical protein RJD23_01545 [Buchnera aphidicola (Ceratoglyphina bambusae)]|uniref:exodeoxyribonuclease V subunit gamma n=1 Tax=Buchnera aphidicola TaxID=9 RepID=UPI0031B87BFC